MFPLHPLKRELWEKNRTATTVFFGSYTNQTSKFEQVCGFTGLRNEQNEDAVRTDLYTKWCGIL